MLSGLYPVVRGRSGPGAAARAGGQRARGGAGAALQSSLCLGGGCHGPPAAAGSPGEPAYAEKTIALAREQGFAFWEAQEAIHRGWAMAMQGEGAHGVAAMRAGLAAYQATGAAHWWSHWQALLAEGACMRDKMMKPSKRLSRRWWRSQERQERFYEAEVYRFKGEVLVR